MIEINTLKAEHCLFSSEKLALYLFKGSEAPAVMQLIGKARAVTFDAIGAGSGLEVDLAEEDDYYEHLMLWDKENQCLVGAYRIGFIQGLIDSHGVEGIYLDHIFDFEKAFYDKIGEPGAMELSRSFILPEYQKNPQMLDMLWKGIGLAAKARSCNTLYGSVTISATYSPLSQAILVDTLDRYHSEDRELRKYVTAKHPFIPQTTDHSSISDTYAKQGIGKLNKVIQELENGERSIPPLIRYYIALGAKFLSFQVEESFNNAIYCLLKVDLKSMPGRYKKRFLGE